MSVMLCVWTDLSFHSRYGRPDPFMDRPYDIIIKVVMSSVRYLHTNRFLKEIVSFLSHFPQLIDAFQRMKAMAQGNLVNLWSTFAL